MKNKVYISFLLVMIIVAIFFVIQEKKMLVENKNKPVTNIVPAKYPDEPVGLISQNEKGENVYSNTKYKFYFSYPNGWFTADAYRWSGDFQIFNFVLKPTDLHYSTGQNKIESSVCDGNIVNQNDEGYGTKTIKQVVIAGENSIRADYKDTTGLESVNYNIPIPNFAGKYFCIYIAGDPANFHVLDELVQSIQWGK